MDLITFYMYIYYTNRSNLPNFTKNTTYANMYNVRSYIYTTCLQSEMPRIDTISLYK